MEAKCPVQILIRLLSERQQNQRLSTYWENPMVAEREAIKMVEQSGTAMLAHQHRRVPPTTSLISARYSEALTQKVLLHISTSIQRGSLQTRHTRIRNKR